MQRFLSKGLRNIRCFWNKEGKVMYGLGILKILTKKEMKI